MAALDDQIAKAFEFAQEVTKQLITLATGIIALTITFLVDVLHGGQQGVGWLKAAWILYLLSIPCGLGALMAMSGNLERPGEGKAPSIYRSNIVTASIGQIVTFTVGLALTLVFGFQAL